MKYTALGCLLFFCSAAASAQSVEVGSGEWDMLPELRPEGSYRITEEMVEQVHQIAASGACTVPGLTARRVEITVPIIMQFGTNGAVERLVVRNMGCPQLESIIGGVALQLARRGSYRSTGENQTGWYRTEMSFLSR